MGCDGGTIPKRDELVKTKKKPEQKDKDSVVAFKWRNCSVSQESLRVPIVGCELGCLYSKEAVLEALIAKNMPENAKHIRSLKDVKELHFTPNRAKEDKISGPRTVADYMCPVSALEMNGSHKFVAIWSCGCVFSERALKHVPTTTCHVCQKPFEPEDVVTLNPEGDDLKDMEARMEARRARAKAAKKEKKKERSPTTEEGTDKTSEKTNGLKRPAEPVPSTSKFSKMSDSSASTSVDGEKKPKKAGLDPKQRESYKSLFTSHETAKKRPTAHWVTYNPFFN